MMCWWGALLLSLLYMYNSSTAPMIYVTATIAFAFCASFSTAPKVPITIGQNTFVIMFNPAEETLSTVATKFCVQHADNLGYNPQNPLTDDNIVDCVNPVVEHLNNALINDTQRQLDAAVPLAVRNPFLSISRPYSLHN
jgi:hypothetical protein